MDVFFLFFFLTHLLRACNFKSSFLQSPFIRFLKVKLLSIVMPRNFSIWLPSINELLILMDLALKGDKNKCNFELFALKLSCKGQSNAFKISVRTAAHTLSLSRASFIFQSLLRSSVGHFIPDDNRINIEGKSYWNKYTFGHIEVVHEF